MFVSKRLFIECTNTSRGGVNTGIQRVVRNIIKESEGVSKEFELEVVPVIFMFDSLWRVGNGTIPFFSSGMWLRRAGGLFDNLRSCFNGGRSGLNKNGLPQDITEPRLKVFVRSMLECLFNGLLFLPVSIFFYKHRVNPVKGDILLCADLWWEQPIASMIMRMKKAGLITVVVIYDLIPITHPQFVPFEHRKVFDRIFRDMIMHIDNFVCISRTVCDEVREFIQASVPERAPFLRLDSFNLGCTLDGVSDEGRMSDAPKAIFDGGKTYIAVGTIEPRKNHRYLLDAFDAIWSVCPDVSLMIIGKEGWSNDLIISRIRSHPLFGKRLFMFNNMVDDDLNYCYRNARALIFSSVVEGFGLPIVEGLYCALPVFVSDIPIHREVGKDFCTYFDLRDPASLAALVVDVERKDELPEVRNRNEYKIATWEDSCRDLFSKVMTLKE